MAGVRAAVKLCNNLCLPKFAEGVKALLDPTLLLRGQLLEYFPEVTPQFAIQRHSQPFGNEHNVVFAVQLRVT